MNNCANDNIKAILPEKNMNQSSNTVIGNSESNNECQEEKKRIYDNFAIVGFGMGVTSLAFCILSFLFPTHIDLDTIIPFATVTVCFSCIGNRSEKRRNFCRAGFILAGVIFIYYIVMKTINICL